MIHCALAITDISCSCCKRVSLRNHGSGDKDGKENDGESWKHFQMKLLWPRGCCLILIQFFLKFCYLAALLFDKLVIKGLPTDREGRDANNTNKELKQPFMKLFLILLIKQWSLFPSVSDIGRLNYEGIQSTSELNTLKGCNWRFSI